MKCLRSCCAVIMALVAAPAWPQNPPSPYTLPSFVKLQKKLEQSCSVLQQNVPLRAVLQSIESTYEIPIWRDRRIDPDALVSLNIAGQPLLRALDAIAEKTGGEIGIIESVVVLGPSGSVARLEASYVELFQRWALGRKSSKALTWPVATSPHELLKRTCREEDLQPDTKSPKLEADLWPSGGLPEVSIAAKLTLLFGGFDLAPLPPSNDKALAWRALPDKTNFPLRYTAIQAKKLDDWKKRWPNLKVTGNDKSGYEIEGPAKAHRDLLASPTNGSSNAGGTSKDPFANQAFTLNFRGTAGQVLTGLQEQQKLAFDPWPLPEDAMQAMIVLDVKNVTIDQLLDRIGSSISLRFKRVHHAIRWELAPNRDR